MNEEIKNVTETVEEIAPAVGEELVSINNADKAMAGVVLGFAGVGVASTLAGAGFGIYKLVKFIKGKADAKKAAAPVAESEAVEEIAPEA